MSDLTVKELKEKLQDVIDTLDNYEDNDTIEIVGNTYFIRSTFYAQVGCKGFVALTNIEDNINPNDDEEEE